MTMSESKNINLNKAKRDKNDEFYTQYADIEKEIYAYLDFKPNLFKNKTVLLPCDDPTWSNFTKYFLENFEKLGLERVVSTCIANQNNRLPANKHQKGKILTIDRHNYKSFQDVTGIPDKLIQYLVGDGDFRSSEVTELAKKADFIITNPPFSLFREFMDWVVKTGKQFSIIGNMNAITCKEIFPLIKENKVWLGSSISAGDREFRVPDDYEIRTQNFRIDENGQRYIRVSGVRWFTNIDYGRRHRLLPLNTISENKRANKRVKADCYQPYSNYKAIEISSSSVIPDDFDGYMGVPISFLDKHNPNQFEIVGLMENWDKSPEMEKLRTDPKNRNRGIVQGDNKRKYARIIIKKRGRS